MATPTTQDTDSAAAPAASGAPGAVHRVRIPLRITDFVGTHVNNVKFQEFSQDARIMFFREKFGVPGSRVPVALARWMEIDFRRSLAMGVPEVWVDVQTLRVGRTSYTMRTSIGSESTGSEPCAVVDTVMVVTAADETTTLEITPEERAALLGHREEAG